MSYVGDFTVGATVRKWFTTQAAAGSPVAPSSAFEAADLVIYKSSSGTPRSSSSGVTMTSPLNSTTGLHRLLIDLSDNTDAGFYAAGNDYAVVLVPDETVDGLGVTKVLCEFSIENRHSGALASASVIADAVWDELTSGHAIAGSFGDKIGAHIKTVLKVVVGSGSTTGAVVLNATTGIDGAAPSSNNDFYGTNRRLIFTSGALAGHACDVTDYDGASKTFTVTTLPSAPLAAVTAVLV